MKFEMTHKTPSAAIRLQLSLESTDVRELQQYDNAEYFHSLCKTGCENYDKKWSCPPHSPSFSKYSKGFNSCMLILFSCELSQFDYIKAPYMKTRASNSVLKSQADKFSRFLEEELPGKMLTTGSCRLCRTCSKKQGSESCNHPQKLRFSLESLGLNLSEVSEHYFGHSLQWYQEKTAPIYSTTLSGVLAAQPQDSALIKRLVEKYGSLNNTSISQIE